MKRVSRLALYSFLAFFWAVFYGLLTYLTVYPLIVQERVLIAYVVNFTIILGILLEDKITQKLMKKRKTKDKSSLILSALTGMSFKTSLYLFYFCTLIVSVILRTNPDIVVTESFREYVFTLEYGVLFLVAADMFIKQLLKDSKRIRNTEKL